MGTINYGTSEYITLGWEPIEVSEEYMNRLRQEYDDFSDALDSYVDSYIEDCYNLYRENIESILNKYDFSYYRVKIESGYYEGFYLDIENELPYAFDCWKERKEVNKEITKLKNFLMECADFGMVEVLPGWCTKYSGYIDTIRAINQAIKVMRQEIKDTPTWRQYEKMERERERG